MSADSSADSGAVAKGSNQSHFAAADTTIPAVAADYGAEFWLSLLVVFALVVSRAVWRLADKL